MISFQNFLVSKTEMFPSPFLVAYRKSYDDQHVLIKMIEGWRENLDNNFFVGAVLTRTGFPKLLIA